MWDMIICGDRSFADVANEVIQKLIEQGGTCINKGYCAYGDGMGRHCAIGWLISSKNDKAMTSNEDLPGLIDGVCISFEENLEWIKTNKEPLYLLQLFHDEGGHVKDPKALTLKLDKLMCLGVDEKLINEFISVL